MHYERDQEVHEISVISFSEIIILMIFFQFSSIKATELDQNDGVSFTNIYVVSFGTLGHGQQHTLNRGVSITKSIM